MPLLPFMVFTLLSLLASAIDIDIINYFTNWFWFHLLLILISLTISQCDFDFPLCCFWPLFNLPDIAKILLTKLHLLSQLVHNHYCLIALSALPLPLLPFPLCYCPLSYILFMLQWLHYPHAQVTIMPPRRLSVCKCDAWFFLLWWFLFVFLSSNYLGLFGITILFFLFFLIFDLFCLCSYMKQKKKFIFLFYFILFMLHGSYFKSYFS